MDKDKENTKNRLDNLKKLLVNKEPKADEPKPEPFDTIQDKKPKVKKSIVKTLHFDQNLTKEQITFLSNYISLDYNITNCCAIAGVSRNCYYDWIKTSPAFKQSMDALEQSYIDKAMETLSKAMNIGDTKAAIFILKTKGKDRGFGDTLDLTSNGNTFTTPIINIILPNTDELDSKD